MTRIALVRHGLTEWNRARRYQGRSDIPLAAEGYEQAAQAAALLAPLGPWNRVIASPLQRAAQTAKTIARALGLDVAGYDDDLVERSYGEAEGRPIDEVSQIWPDRDYPGAESPEAVVARGRRAIARLAEVDGTIGVAHGTFIRMTAAAVSGADFPRIPNGAVVVLEAAHGAWSANILALETPAAVASSVSA